LIGQGVGYRTFSEVVDFTASNTATLTKDGIDASSIVVSGFVPDPNATNQSLPATFRADVTGSSPATHDYGTAQTGSGDASVTTITRETSGAIQSPYLQVTVTYHYTDTGYHSLNYFTDFATLSATYGPALDSVTGDLISPLTMAAQIAMQNGANQIFAIALEGSGSVQQQFADAYSLLSAQDVSVNMVVPLWVDQTVTASLEGMLATLNSALQRDAGNGVLRMAVVGFDQSYAPAGGDLTTMATGIASERIVMVWPNQLQAYNTYTASTMILDGFYLAAALAGVMVTLDPEVPLTRKIPQGFNGFPTSVLTSLSTSVKNALASSGITVCEMNRTNNIVVRQGYTTDYAGGILTREISLVRAQDALYTLIRQNVDGAGLIGQAITEDTALQVKSIVAGALQTAIATQLIQGYSGFLVREQAPPSGDPTVIEIQFAYQPSWPLNYILVSFSVDTSTGVTNLNSSSSITNTSSSGATTS
jgi:hypothetical protein